MKYLVFCGNILLTHECVFYLGGAFVKKIKKFFKGISKERKMVRWPDSKTLTKYSLISIILIAFFGLYFYGLDALFALIRGLI